MAIQHASRAVEHLRQAVLRSDGEGLVDAELLELFVTRRDQAAFAALVRRHGPMVLGVCRRVAANEQDAEDAFQATFLALARKAASLRQRELVGNWLYGAAYRAALEARTAATRRRAKEKQVAEMPERSTLAESDPAEEWRPLLDRELSRLPDKYRVPVVLCELQGRKRKDVARQLGIPEGTLSSRLATARQMLARRLAQHGLNLSGSALALALAQSATAAVPASLVTATVKAAAGGVVAVGVVSAKVAALTDGVLKALFLAKLKAATELLAMVLVLAGTGFLAHHLAAKPADATQAGKPKRSVDVVQEQVRTDFYGDPLPEGAVARMGSVRLRHTGLGHYAILPDSKTVLTAGRDRVLRFWDMASGRQVREVKLQGTAIPSLLFALSPDGKTLVAEDKLKKLVLWDVASGAEIQTLPAPERAMVSYLYFSPDGKTLAVGRRDWRISFWDWATGTERQVPLPYIQRPVVEFRMDSTFHGRFSPDSKWFVAAANWAEPLAIFEVATGREVHRLTCYAYTSAVSPDSKRLFVSSMQNDQGERETVLRVFDLASGKEEKQLRMGKEPIHSLVFSPDGKTLACGLSEHSCFLDSDSGRVLRRLSGWPSRLAFAPDGKTAVAGEAQCLRIWNVATGKDLHELRDNFGHAPALATTRDGRLLAAAAWMDQSVALWDTNSGKLIRRLPLKGEGKYVRNLTLSPDGQTLIASQFYGLLQFWDTATGQERRTVQLQDPDHPNKKFVGFYQLHMSSDGKHVSTLERILAGPGESTRLALWETTTGKLVRQHNPFPGELPQGAWSADGMTVALPLGDGLSQMEVKTGVIRMRISGASTGPLLPAPEYRYLMGLPSLGSPVASPDDRLLAGWREAGADGKAGGLGVWEAATGKEVVALATGRADRIALTPDNRLLFTVDNRFLRVWDLATGKERHHWPLPEAGYDFLRNITVERLLLSPDGRRAFTALADGTALVWDLTPALSSVEPLAKRAGEKEIAGWWADLASEDAGRAYAAVWRLAEAPEKAAVTLLRKHLRPAADADIEKTRQLVRDLDSDQFEVREKAFKQLENLGNDAVPALREALERNPSAEARRRLETLLARPSGLVTSPEILRRLRAIQVLERIASADARRVLGELAGGVAHAPETQHAKASLERLTRGSGAP